MQVDTLKIRMQNVEPIEINLIITQERSNLCQELSFSLCRSKSSTRFELAHLQISKLKIGS